MIMHRPGLNVLLVLLSLALASLACSLTTSEETEQARIEDIQQSPLVLLIAPVNGSTYAEGVPVALYAIAQETNRGVARIEFRVDDVAVGEVAATEGESQDTLEAQITWESTGQTGHLITVEAFRADGSSLGMNEVTVRVVEPPTAQLPSSSARTSTPATDQTPEAAESPAAPTGGDSPAPTTAPVATAAPQTSGPTARINSPNLNVRQGPGTSYPAVGVLADGEVVPLVGRNNDSSWWAINYAGGTAWIFAGLTATQGDTSSLPLVAPPPAPPTNTPTNTPPPAAPADLVIDSLRLDPPTPQVGVTFTVYAVVRNAGQTASPEADAMATFQPGSELSPADPRIPALQPGESREIFFRVTLHEAAANVTGTVQVDVNNVVDEGAAGETNNTRTIAYSVNP
ncbi:MAG: SH3 domain-containing protein [Chloroflexi bacterium]|nr:SH3 domain-containing protein [Chloroflexota bacterium]